MRFVHKCLMLALVMTAVLLASKPSEIKSIAGPGVLFELLSLNRDVETPKFPHYLSPTAMAASPDGAYLYIAGETGKQVRRFNIKEKKVDATYPLPNDVTGCAVSPDGTTLFVTCSSPRWPAGKLHLVQTSSGRVAVTIAVGFGARAPVVTPDGKKVLVCNQYDNTVSIVSVVQRQVTATLNVGREPYCAAITPDGKTAIVGNLRPADLSTDSLSIASTVALIDMASDNIETSIKLPRGDESILGVAVSPDGMYAFVTHLNSRFALLGSTVVSGHIQVNAVSVIDIKNRKYCNGISLDNANKGAGNPCGIVCSKDGNHLAITHAGSNVVSILQLPSLMDSVLLHTKDGTNMLSRFTYLLKIRARVEVASVGPRCCAIISDTLYTAGYFNETPTVEQIPLSLDKNIVSATFPIDEKKQLSPIRTGEEKFYDANLCFQSWQSCHSCHPFGGTDGFYHILNSGVSGYPTNTKSLTMSWQTPPADWNGRRENAHAGVFAGIQLQLFQTPTDTNLLPLDSFVANIRPVASPYREKGGLSASAQRGKMLFNSDKAGCFTCHPAPLFTDNKLYSGMITDQEYQSSINTPSLVECWKSAPYGHLGSIGDIREMVSQNNHHPKTPLSTEELNDLCRYVLSL